MGEVSFTMLFSELISLFETVYSTGLAVYLFFFTPLEETTFIEWIPFIGEVSGYTPAELCFGAGILYTLVLIVVKFCVSLFPI